MGKAKEIAELGDKITVSGGTVTVADISASTFSGTSIHSMQDVDLTGIAHNMFLKYNLSNTQFEVVAGNTSSIDEGTNLYYTDARVASYLSSNDFDTATNIVASITDSAPGTLDTLNELAAALGDDANFSTTVTNSIATKLPLSGGTLTGNLNINGNTSVTANLPTFTITGQGRVNGFEIAGTASNTTLTEKSNNGLTFGTNNTPRMIIDNLGRVKIGTTSNTPASANEPGIVFGDNTAGTATVGVASFVANGAAPLLLTRRTNDGNVLGIADDTTTRGLLRVDGGDLNVSSNANLRLSAGGSSAKMTIAASGDVGIGTNNPQARLHTRASVNNFRMEDADTNGYANVGVDNSGSLYLQADHGNTRSSSFIRFFIDGNEDMFLDEYGQLALTSNPSTFFLGGTSNGSFVKGTNTGNYLIFGTSAAEVARFTGNTFQLKGGGVIKSDGTVDTIVLSGSNGVNTGGNITLHGNNHSNASQIFFKNGSSNVMTIASGNVGIGTDSPSVLLHAVSPSTAIARFQGSNEGNLYITNDDDYVMTLQTSTSTSMAFNTAGGNERMRITSGGDVSIGSDHAGFSGWRVLNMRQLSTGALINFEDDDSTRAFTFASQGSGMRYQAHIPGGYHRWETNATATALYITDGGNVGIGISDPTEKLTMTVGNGGGILQSTYYSGTVTNGQKLGVIGFKGYSQGNTVAGADAKIEGVAASNHSGSSAPAHLDFYTKPESIGPGSAAVLRHRIHEEGHQTIFKGTNNWSVQRHSQSSGCYVCHRLYGAGSSTTTYNLLRYRRHYWGSGSVKFTLSQTYYSGTAEGEYWLTGHGRSDGSYNPSYNISYVEVYNGPGSSRLSTNMPGGSPGNSDAEIVDVSISIPAYYYYMVRVEVSHSEYYTTTGVMGSHNSFALFT